MNRVGVVGADVRRRCARFALAAAPRPPARRRPPRRVPHAPTGAGTRKRPPQAPASSGRARAADPAGGARPLRIKKIAERRTIWGGGRLRRKRGAEDHGDGREQPQERGARRLDRLHLPGGAGPSSEGPGLGHGRHPDRRTAPRLARAARIFARRPGAGPGATARPPHAPAQAFAGHAETTGLTPVTSRAGGARRGKARPPAPRPARRAARGRLRERARARARRRFGVGRRRPRRSSGRRASKATSWACGPGAADRLRTLLRDSRRSSRSSPSSGGLAGARPVRAGDGFIYAFQHRREHSSTATPWPRVYRSRAGSSGSLQAGSLVSDAFLRRPLFTFWTCSCDHRSSRTPPTTLGGSGTLRHRLSDPANSLNQKGTSAQVCTGAVHLRT